MADASYDVVIVGGGNKGLVAAIYLAKYGGMDVGIFERRFELGGALSSSESAAPGFVIEPHTFNCSLTYFLPVELDFPDLIAKGGKQAQCKAVIGAITREDHKCCCIYNEAVDPTQEKTASEIARLSERDAETFMKIWDYGQKTNIKEVTRQTLFNLPPPVGEPTPLERWFADYVRQPDAVVDAEWAINSALDAGLQLFENFGVTLMFLRKALAAGTPPVEPFGAVWLIFVRGVLGVQDVATVVGSSHNLAHAYIRIFLENGGKYFTHSHVDKIIIEDGTAKGIRLADGTEIKARKLGLTDVDPWQLCFELIGREHLPRRIIKKMETLTGGKGSLAWYSWALNEPLNFKAADFNPDINHVQQLALGSHDPNIWFKEYHMRELGEIPPIESSLLWMSMPEEDRKARIMSGNGTINLSEKLIPQAARFSEQEWLQFKKDHAEAAVREVYEYAPNMTWDNIIGIGPETSYDVTKRLINFPFGCSGCVDRDKWRPRSMRPCSEWAQHNIAPIKNLYGTGAGWDPAATCDAGYKAYKAIAEDFGLRKPWEEKGRAW